MPTMKLAGNRDLGTYTPTQLFAGESEIVTGNYPVGADLAQYQVFAVNASGNAVPVAPAETDGTQIAVGVTAQAATVAQGNVPVYEAGYFNHEVLVWPAAWDTLAERKAAFARTTIKIGQLV